MSLIDDSEHGPMPYALAAAINAHTRLQRACLEVIWPAFSDQITDILSRADDMPTSFPITIADMATFDELGQKWLVMDLAAAGWVTTDVEIEGSSLKFEVRKS